MTGKKRTYIAPKIEMHKIDQEICLVMMTTPPDNGGDGDPPLGGMSSSTFDYAPTLKSDQPFGGSTPDFSNME